MLRYVWVRMSCKLRAVGNCSGAAASLALGSGSDDHGRRTVIGVRRDIKLGEVSRGKVGRGKLSGNCDCLD